MNNDSSLQQFHMGKFPKFIMNHKTLILLITAFFCQPCVGLLLEDSALALPLEAVGPCAVGVKAGSRSLDYRRGSSWTTNCGGIYKFIFQSDGNVVLYNSSNYPLWATGTAGSKADKFSIQSDGNVVLYEGSRPVWASNTSGNPGSFFIVQTDGNVVVYKPSGQSIFNTGTNGNRRSTLSASPTWLTPNPPTRYFPGLLSWNEEKWDKESGDGYHFDGRNDIKGAKTGLADTSPELKQVSKDLSKSLLGAESYMTTGYAYDVNPNYNGENRSHAGIDYQANTRTAVSVVVPGKVIRYTNYGGIGQFVTIQADDGNRWIYGHVSTSLREGNIVKVGDRIGTVFNQGGNSHFHIEVHNPPFDNAIIGGIPYQTKGQLSFVLRKTISPLQAYWKWRNR